MELLFFVFIIIVITFTLAQQSNLKFREREKIQNSLENEGKQVVDIKVRTSSNGKGSPNVYDVTYTTPENELYKVQCICWRQSELFWTEPKSLKRVSRQTEQPLPLRQGVFDMVKITAENTTPNKETIIYGLTSGSIQKRISTIHQLKNIEQVDEIILYILMDMANDDPAPEVRKVARETLKLIDSSHEPTLT